MKKKVDNIHSISPRSPRNVSLKRSSNNKINRKNKFLMHVFKPVTVSGSFAMSIQQSIDPHTYKASPKIHNTKQIHLKERELNTYYVYLYA